MKAPRMQTLLIAGAVLAGAYLFFLGGVFALMHMRNEVAGKGLSLVGAPAFMVLPMESMWCRARRGRLEVGHVAPDFDLPTRDGASRVRLSALRGTRPVVLAFGSYTCPPFRREMPAVGRVYDSYRDRADFFFIYIEEAHAHDVWPLASNARDSVMYGTAKDAAERTGVASLCTKALRIGLPTLVDDMANSTAEAYAAWPTRLYVVDPDGRIAYKSRPGPFGFEASGLADALARIVPVAATSR